jgi:signal transduction histidine kinase
MQINPFALHDLVGMVAAGLFAAVFYSLYWALSRDRIHLLLANTLACATVVCLASFLMDNLTPAGEPARATPDAARRMLGYLRLLYVSATVSFPLVLQFVAAYCKLEGPLRRPIRWAYGAALVLPPLIWSRLFFAPRARPICETSSWSCAVPWFPRMGMGFYAYATVWIGANLAVQLLLVRQRWRARDRGEPAAHAIGVASATIVLPIASAIVEMTLAAFGSVGITLFPIGITAGGVTVGAALLRDAVDERKWRLALERTNRALRAEIAERQRVETERARLDAQLDRLNYLDRLRTALSQARSADEIVQVAGRTLLEALPGPASLATRHDGRLWRFGAAGVEGRAEYARPLVYGGRERGRFSLFSPVVLREAQERVLADETAGQIALALEARELEAQLVQSARLVALGQMAAAVAHELKQPLSAISTTATDVYLRLVDGVGLTREELSAMMRDVRGFTERMAEIIDHLRIFSRDTADEPDVLFSVNDVVRSGVKLLNAQLVNHDIALLLELSEDLPPVSGHPRQIEQVFLNLLANARDAVDEKPAGAAAVGAEKRVTVRTTRVLDGIPWVAVEVEDSGVGMHEATVARVFEPFFTTKPADRGTGLGLAIAYALVRNHEGRLSCESEAGEGTVFRVALPAVEGATDGPAG